MDEPTLSPADRATALTKGYHDRSKHRLGAYAAGPDTLDWDAQPDPFRRYRGAPLTPLPLQAEALSTPWAQVAVPGQVSPHALDVSALGLLFELSLALSAWKQLGPDRWAVRVNPSSGNLHPTEAWLLCQGVPGVPDGVHHYAPHEHALEWRGRVAAPLPGGTDPVTPRAWVALSSIAWREAWKYGERAFRYVQLDTGHALGALRYAAATLGWQVQCVPCGTSQLAHALGLDRDADFGHAEREEPELLLALLPAGATTAPSAAALSPPPFDGPPVIEWLGAPNRLDRHPMYRWPVVDTVAAATRPPPPATLPAAHTAPAARPVCPPAAPQPPLRHVPTAAALIRQRRSAQRFDTRARCSLAQFWPLLQALHPARLPLDAWPAAPRVHLLVFPHRVDGLAPGACLLPRSVAGLDLWGRHLPTELDMRPEPGAPADAPLLRLADNPALAGTLRTLNCHQALGSDAVVGFAMLAEFDAWSDASAYRARLQEAGLLGQALYLEAEAAGLRGTGIGCFFDDPVHRMVGLPESAAAGAPLQSVYHFTVGVPVTDDRITTEPPYAHLSPRFAAHAPEGTPHD